MNLTLDKFSRGAVSVIGGRLLEVVTDHGVSLATLPVADSRENQYRFRSSDEKAKYTFAKVGDLAVEIFYRKTGKLLGYSYLTGDAIQARMDAPTDGGGADLFRPIEGHLIELPVDKHYPAPESPEEAEEIEKSKKLFFASVIEVLAKAKFGAGHKLAAFDYKITAGAPVETVVKGVADIWQGIKAERVSGEKVAAGAVNLMGLIHGRNMRREKITAILNIQPEDRKQDYGVTPFQVGLVVDSLKRAAKEAARRAS